MLQTTTNDAFVQIALGESRKAAEIAAKASAHLARVVHEEEPFLGTSNGTMTARSMMDKAGLSSQ